MRALALVHRDDTQTGTVGERMLEAGFDVTVATAEEELPEPGSLDAVVVYGSAKSAYDDTLPWLARELAYVRAAVDARTPVFGICFGGQLLSRVLGGTVARSPHPEIGWVSVDSSEPSFVPHGPWMEFHYDRFTLPGGAIAIARSSRALQAFTFGPHLGVQFHPEISPAVFERWLIDCCATGEIEELQAMGVDLERIGEEVLANEHRARAAGMRLFDAFFERAQRIGRTRALALGGG